MSILKLTLISLLLPAAFACSRAGGSSAKGSGGSNANPDSPGGAQGAGTSTAGPNTIMVTPAALTVASIFTKTSGGNTCAPVSFTVTKGGSADAGANVSFSVASTSGATDIGTVSPATKTTDGAGLVSASYCSGAAPGSFVVIAKAENVSANSGTITVTTKATFTFTFTTSDLPIHSSTADTTTPSSVPAPTPAPVVTPASPGLSLADATPATPAPTTPAPATPAAAPAPAPAPATAADPSTAANKLGVIYLNLADSGPHDCAHLTFTLTQSGTGLAAAPVRFSTQTDFPKGAKLGLKTDKVQTAADANTKHLYAYYDAVSNGSGEFDVPICAGTGLGSILVSGTYTSPDGTPFKALSPVIVIQSGITSWLDMTLTYSQPNGHTMFGYLNSNTTQTQPFTVNLGSSGNGDAITDYSIFAASEAGKVVLTNGGAIDPATNSAQFSVKAVNLQDDRPYPVTMYPAPAGNTVCDPELLAQGTADVTYPQLAKNWRSTVVYGLRGQEFFHDAVGDGVYHPGCTGFWDKNQNGIFDAGDVITFDPFGDGKLHNECDWFIDLPSPFIDVNENGVYDPGVDVLIADTYQAPNGKWDNDTIIWKYDYTPIYMGTSPYAMQHSSITHGNFGSLTETLASNYFADLVTRGIDVPPSSRLFGTIGAQGIIRHTDLIGGAWGDLQWVNTFVFAHSVCGTPLPGGSKLSITFSPMYTPKFGDRPFVGSFDIQPVDNIRPPSRRLLSQSDGSSTAVVNFDVVDHPSAAAGYPVIGKISVSGCVNACTGTVAVPGVACDGKIMKANFTSDTDTITQEVNIDAYIDCQCAAGSVLKNGVCTTP